MRFRQTGITSAVMADWSPDLAENHMILIISGAVRVFYYLYTTHY
jgi:hypothetical protein